MSDSDQTAGAFGERAAAQLCYAVFGHHNISLGARGGDDAIGQPAEQQAAPLILG